MNWDSCLVSQLILECEFHFITGAVDFFVVGCGCSHCHGNMLTVWTFSFLCFGRVLVYGSYGVLVNLSKVNGKIPFSSSALNLIIESIKVGGCALGVHSHMHTHMHVHKHTHMHVHTHTRTQMHTHTYTSSPSRLADVHTFSQVHTYSCTQTPKCTHACTHARTHTHIVQTDTGEGQLLNWNIWRKKKCFAF